MLAHPCHTVSTAVRPLSPAGRDEFLYVFKTGRQGGRIGRRERRGPRPLGLRPRGAPAALGRTMAAPRKPTRNTKLRGAQRSTVWVKDDGEAGSAEKH